MSYLYNESDRRERVALAGHLRDCPDCAALVHDWQFARKSLDGWRARPATASAAARWSPSAGFTPALRWAAALAAILVVGFGAGRISSAVDAKKIRAAIEPQIRQELRQEIAEMLNKELNRTTAATLAASGDQSRAIVA